VLQACALERGFKVAIIYANLMLAERIGDTRYEAICYAPTTGLIGERLFSALAYSMPPLGRNAKGHEDVFKRVSRNVTNNLSYDELRNIESQLAPWLKEFVEKILSTKVSIIGCTTTFEQTSASVAILANLKRLSEDIITIIGGANCEGEMATGVSTLSPAIDYIFSGESEDTFPSALAALTVGDRPPNRILEGRPNRALDKLPTPSFTDYYEQLAILGECLVKRSGNIWLPYETSRGCWWGEKRHCTFCGINGQGMDFRQKSADRALEELAMLLSKHPTNKICMVDNIMPFNYFQTLLPRIRAEVGEVHIFYEQKANLTFDKVCTLKDAGVQVIQPGIEALSSPLLKLMRKGVSAEQNIRLLRYARSVNLSVNWNLLYAFPGDEAAWYTQTLNLLPLLAHLNPPTGLFHLSIDRFSPYFDSPSSFNVSGIRPVAEYYDVFPENCDISRIAYHFEAAYESGSRENQPLISQLRKKIDEWRDLWTRPDSAPPLLEIAQLDAESFLLVDSRPGSKEQFIFMTEKEATAILTGQADHDILEWALDRNLVVALEDMIIPLATAQRELFDRFAAAPPVRAEKSSQKQRLSMSQ
jgi:ribosomal peptide maturation radical SAM protein 1